MSPDKIGKLEPGDKLYTRTGQCNGVFEGFVSQGDPGLNGLSSVIYDNQGRAMNSDKLAGQYLVRVKDEQGKSSIWSTSHFR